MNPQRFYLVLNQDDVPLNRFTTLEAANVFAYSAADNNRGRAFYVLESVNRFLFVESGSVEETETGGET